MVLEGKSARASTNGVNGPGSVYRHGVKFIRHRAAIVQQYARIQQVSRGADHDESSGRRRAHLDHPRTVVGRSVTANTVQIADQPVENARTAEAQGVNVVEVVVPEDVPQNADRRPRPGSGIDLDELVSPRGPQHQVVPGSVGVDRVERTGRIGSVSSNPGRDRIGNVQRPGKSRIGQVDSDRPARSGICARVNRQ